MTFLARLAVLIVAVFVQLTWIPRLFPPGSPYPSLVLTLLLLFSWSRPLSFPLVLAILSGLLIDLAQPGPVGVHSLAFVAGLFGARLLQERFEASPFIVAAAGLIAGAAYGFALLAVAAAHAHAPQTIGGGAYLALGSSLADAALLLLLWKPVTLLFPNPELAA